MGLYVTLALLKAGAQVTVLARSVNKARQVLKNYTNVTIEYLDLSKFDTIKTFTEHYLATNQPLHLLINYAGLISLPHLTLNKQGIEMQLATNHMGHFLLTTNLWPALQQAKGARVVTVASRAHRFSPFCFNDPNFSYRPYKTWQAYGQSKTANILFTVALDEWGKNNAIRAFAVHPGVVLGHGMFQPFLTKIVNVLCKISLVWAKWRFKTATQAASTVLWAATSPLLNNSGGVYCEDCNIAPVVANNPKIAYGVRDYAINQENAHRLWQWSKAQVG